jgi:hypothetical protein
VWSQVCDLYTKSIESARVIWPSLFVKYIALCLVFLTTEGVNFSREIPAQMLYNLEPPPEHKLPAMPIPGGTQSC